MINISGKNLVSDKNLERICTTGAVLTISLVVASVVALVITQAGIFHPHFSPLIGIGLGIAAISTAFITHILGNVLVNRDGEGDESVPGESG